MTSRSRAAQSWVRLSPRRGSRPSGMTVPERGSISHQRRRSTSTCGGSLWRCGRPPPPAGSSPSTCDCPCGRARTAAPASVRERLSGALSFHPPGPARMQADEPLDWSRAEKLVVRGDLASLFQTELNDFIAAATQPRVSAPSASLDKLEPMYRTASVARDLNSHTPFRESCISPVNLCCCAFCADTFSSLGGYAPNTTCRPNP